MDAVIKARKLSEMFKLIPVKGEPNTYIIESGGPAVSTNREMTEEDWDKFEKDIHDAFGQVDDDPVEIP